MAFAGELALMTHEPDFLASTRFPSTMQFLFPDLYVMRPPKLLSRGSALVAPLLRVLVIPEIFCVPGTKMNGKFPAAAAVVLVATVE
jgi:hypothetical protein